MWQSRIFRKKSFLAGKLQKTDEHWWTFANIHNIFRKFLTHYYEVILARHVENFEKNKTAWLSEAWCAGLSFFSVTEWPKDRQTCLEEALLTSEIDVKCFQFTKLREEPRRKKNLTDASFKSCPGPKLCKIGPNWGSFQPMISGRYSQCTQVHCTQKWHAWARPTFRKKQAI